MMAQKTLLLLGAAYFQVPVIEYARAQGIRVLTCDNRPQNPGHALADAAFTISTLDKPQVLALARQQKIDGILAYGSDVSTATAAFVAENMGLAYATTAAITTLTNKDKFRAFLNATGLQPLAYQTFTQTQTVQAQAYAGEQLPVVIKPTFNSGSKGVRRVQATHEITPAINEAFAKSLSGKIIIEKFVEKYGPQICGDGFIQAGKIIFFAFGDGYFYEQGMVPYAESFPSQQNPVLLQQVLTKTEHILQTAQYDNGPFNLDAMITRDKKPFIFEIGPRNGGNFIPQAIYHHCGVNLVAAAVQMALGLTVELSTSQHAVQPIASYMLHSDKAGQFKTVNIHPLLQPHLLQLQVTVAPQEWISPLTDASHTLGNVLLKFSSQQEMLTRMQQIQQLCQVELYD